MINNPLLGDKMEWKIIEKKVVKRGTSSTGINFSKEELPASAIGNWVKIKVPEDFGSFQSSEEISTGKDLEKENAAYLKARRQIYQNVFYYVIGSVKRRPDLVTSSNVMLFIKIRDSLENYYTDLQYKIIQEREIIENKMKNYDIINGRADGYKEILFFVDTYKTTMFINEAEYDSYILDFHELEQYNKMLIDMNETVLSYIKNDFPDADPLIVQTAIDDYFNKEDHTTKKLLTEHSKMIFHGITKGRK